MYVELKTGVSGVKKNGEDRRRAGAGQVEIDEDVRAEYEALVRR